MLDLLQWMESPEFHINIKDFLSNCQFHYSLPSLADESIRTKDLEIMKWTKQYLDDTHYDTDLIVGYLHDETDFSVWIVETLSYSKLRGLEYVTEPDRENLIRYTMDTSGTYFKKVCRFLNCTADEQKFVVKRLLSKEGRDLLFNLLIE